jgi:Tol biopolymer transport system component
LLLPAFLVWAFASVSAEEAFLFQKPFSGVYLMEGDEQEIIIHRQGKYIAPRLSPDGEKVLFHSIQGGEIAVWLTDPQGEKSERLCDGDQANWSPDGKKIIFRREGRIVEREIASGKETIVTPEDLQLCEFPSYLPDGRVVFVSRGKTPEYGKIFVTGSGEKTPPEPLAEGEIGSAPKCSPDGRSIAYQNGAHIYLMDLSERRATQLTIAGGVQSWPMWSQDSKSICYCQSPETFGGPWDICSVEIDSPEKSRLVMRDVEVSPDWHGSIPPTLITTELKGNSISLWQMEKSSKERASWKALPGDSDYDVAAGIAVENDWGIFHLTTGEAGLLISPNEKEETSVGDIEIAIMNEKGELATKTESIYVISNDGDSEVLRVGFRSGEGDVMEATFTVPRSRPFMEIKPAGNTDRVYIRRDMDLAVLPDRFADDLIFDPHGYSAPRVTLPYTPLLIGLLPGGGMVLVITPSNRQDIRLVKGEKEDCFEGIEVLTEGESVFLSFLSGRDLWYRTEVVSDTGGWKMEWSRPFLAQWRHVAAGDGKYYSRMWDEEDLSKSTKPHLPVEWEFPERSELSVIYLYGRSWNTPLDTITPVDILQDTLGTGKLRYTLDIDGLRTYRTTREAVPLHVLLTSQENRLWPEDNPGWPDVLDFSPFYPLFVRIRMVNRNGVESTVTHLCEDILNSLIGLDDRIEEYEKFLVSLERLYTGQDASPFGMEESIKDLRDELADLPITRIRTVSDSIETVRRCMGTGEELWDRSEFYRFWKASGTALSERQEILKRYRDFVKELRNKAGTVITEEPGAKDTSEEVRRLAQNILRERYYLEGDWRGEKPLQ